jgi:hypothetical protein
MREDLLCISRDERLSDITAGELSDRGRSLSRQPSCAGRRGVFFFDGFSSWRGERLRSQSRRSDGVDLRHRVLREAAPRDRNEPAR